MKSCSIPLFKQVVLQWAMHTKCALCFCTISCSTPHHPKIIANLCKKYCTPPFLHGRHPINILFLFYHDFVPLCSQWFLCATIWFHDLIELYSVSWIIIRYDLPHFISYCLLRYRYHAFSLQATLPDLMSCQNLMSHNVRHEEVENCGWVGQN